MNITTLPSWLHARVELTDWFREYNHVRRHSSLGYMTPTECAETWTWTKPDSLPISLDRKRGQARGSTWRDVDERDVDELERFPIPTFRAR